MSLFDDHLPPSLHRLRDLNPKTKLKDRIAHKAHMLSTHENMLNAKEIYKHIRDYSDNCLLHAAYELILDTLYPKVQRQMADWRNPNLMKFPTSAKHSDRTRQRRNPIKDE